MDRFIGNAQVARALGRASLFLLEVFMMRWFLVVLLAVLDAHSAHAQVTAYTNKQMWLQTVPNYQKIDFTGYPENTIINTQYAHLGVQFTDGADFIYHNPHFLNDGVGLRGGIPESVTLQFTSPQQWIAVELVGSLRFRLFNQGQMFFESPLHGGPPGSFAGLVSTMPFDKVIMLNNAGGGVSIDDLYFGPPIPAPGALPLIALATLCTRRRRR